MNETAKYEGIPKKVNCLGLEWEIDSSQDDGVIRATSWREDKDGEPQGANWENANTLDELIVKIAEASERVIAAKELDDRLAEKYANPPPIFLTPDGKKIEFA